MLVPKGTLILSPSGYFFQNVRFKAKNTELGVLGDYLGPINLLHKTQVVSVNGRCYQQAGRKNPMLVTFTLDQQLAVNESSLKLFLLSVKFSGSNFF